MLRLHPRYCSRCHPLETLDDWHWPDLAFVSSSSCVRSASPPPYAALALMIVASVSPSYNIARTIPSLRPQPLAFLTSVFPPPVQRAASLLAPTAPAILFPILRCSLFSVSDPALCPRLGYVCTADVSESAGMCIDLSWIWKETSTQNTPRSPPSPFPFPLSLSSPSPNCRIRMEARAPVARSMNRVTWRIHRIPSSSIQRPL